MTYRTPRSREERISNWNEWRGAYRRDWGRWSATYRNEWFQTYYPRTGKAVDVLVVGGSFFLLIVAVLAYAAVPFVFGAFFGLVDSERISLLLIPIEILWLCLLLGFIVVVLDP